MLQQNSAKQAIKSHVQFFLIIIFTITSFVFWWEKQSLTTEENIQELRLEIQQLQEKYTELKEEIEILKKRETLPQSVSHIPLVVETPKQPEMVTKQKDNDIAKPTELSANVDMQQQQSTVSWKVTPNPAHLQIRTTLRQSNQLLALNVLGQIGNCKLYDLESPVTILVTLQDSIGNRKQIEQTWQPKRTELPRVEQNQNIIVLDEQLPNLRLSGAFQPRKGYVSDVWMIENRTGQTLRIAYQSTQPSQLCWRESSKSSFVEMGESTILDKKIVQIQIKLSEIPTSPTGNSPYQIMVRTQINQSAVPIFFSCQ